MEFAELISTPKVDGVTLHTTLHEPIDGTLCITGHHLILSSRREGVQELWLLHQCIDFIERKPITMNNTLQGGIITLKCKDLRTISLEINNGQDYVNVAASIEQLSNLSCAQYLYPYFYRPMYTILEDGYTMFRYEIEYAKLLASDDWRITHVNRDYTVCPTYGASLVVPKAITDEEIVQSAAFRDGGRFPVLSYRHENGAILLRSSQPNAGPASKRCRADEAILNVILGRTKKGFIVDTWGKGKSNQETDQHYNQWRKVTRSIGNISSVSAILDSFAKLIEACNDTACSTDKWLNRLEHSHWLTLVLNALNAACVVAQCLDQEGSPVLVHGGKGLDSTLIVTSLVQIILNPDCRTVRGIQALIDREWIQAGFPFGTRHKHACYTPSHGRGKTSASTFVLFLDCVHQLHCQFPFSFEFGTQMLILMFEHSFFSQYGTFLGDSECEREQIKLHTKTTSLWSYLNRPDVLKSLLNPLYEPNQGVIWPSVAPISLELWTELYLRWTIEQSPSKSAHNQIQVLVIRQKEARSKAIKLRKELTDLCKEYVELNKQLDDE